ncbi:MAG: glutaminase [Cyclobacteriaceae bacterium]|nr:glutaminase [Cyclobacteriaceae bacterium HetDA_MAG_MS6]
MQDQISTSTDFEQILSDIHAEVQNMQLEAKPAQYIPELANVDPDQFGICLTDLDGHVYGVGDYQQAFSVQSITKVFTLTMVFSFVKNETWQRVNVEPSGNPFNSMVQLEFENGIPRNPFINAGALVITDALVSQFSEPKEAILSFVRSICGNEKVGINQKVYESELAHSSRNRALANFIKSYNNIENDIDTLIDLYCFHCAIEMNCEQLAKSFHHLANHGFSIFNKQQILDNSSTKRMNALMLTCGFYDESGEFAYKVGLPGKSGVGGGAAAVLPGKFSIAAWSPGLGVKGNSRNATKALELLTTKLGVSLF